MIVQNRHPDASESHLSWIMAADADNSTEPLPNVPLNLSNLAQTTDG
jgi:hypothetical protein